MAAECANPPGCHCHPNSVISTSTMTQPPRLTPPGGDRETATDRYPARSLWLGFGLAVMLLLGVAVILVLPGLVDRDDNMVQRPPPPALAVAPAPTPAENEREQAKAALEEVLQRRAELETARVETWGADDYSRLLDLMGGADQAMDAGRFGSATELYQEVLAGFDQLDQSREKRFEAASAAGQKALEAADGSEAKAQFGIALALRPDDEQARRGLARAGTIEEVVRLTREADTLTREGRWQEAQQAYTKAVALDGLHYPAQAGLDRVRAHLRGQDFRQAMSEALNALDKGAFTRAAQALERARTLDPAAPALKEVSSQLVRARRNARLRTLRDQANGAAEDEDWQTAVRLHRRALKLDPNATFAESGLERAQARLELMNKLDHYLKRPQRLQAAKALANAEALLKNANTVGDAGPKLRAARDRLAGLITWAKTPVPVRIHSDNATDVVIYQVGRFGRFEQRELSLRPGTYTAVGSRDGYRDVRKVFRVDTSRPVTDLVIRCEERI